MADGFNLNAIISTQDKSSPGLKAIAKSAQGARKYLLDVGNAASGFANKIGLPLGVLSTIAAGFSLVAIKNAVKSFADAGEAIWLGSKKAGLGVEDYQRWTYVAGQSGVAAEALTGSMGKLNKNLAMAAAGKNQDLSALMKRLGINTRNAKGEIVSAADVMPQLADAFVRNKNEATRARIGTALFGKSWQEIVPLLDEGAEGIAAMQKRFTLLKSAMDEDTVKGAKDFGDQLKDVEIVTKGFQMTIAKELVPVLKPLIEDFIQWAAANRKVVASGVKEFVRDLIVQMKSIDWAGVIQGAKDFGNGVLWVVEAVGGFKNALIGLVVVMNLQAILAFAGLIASIVKMAWAIGAMAIPAIGSMIAWMIPLQFGIGTLALAAGYLVANLAAIAAVGIAAYQATKWIMDITGAAQWLGDKLSSWTGIDAKVANAMAPTGGRTWTGPDAGDQKSLIDAPQKAQVGGVIKVDINGMPPGSRVTQSQGSGGVTFDTSAGYSSMAMGLAF